MALALEITAKQTASKRPVTGSDTTVPTDGKLMSRDILTRTRALTQLRRQ